MTIHYKNLFGEIITQQQAQNSEDFLKYFYENDIVFKRELYMDGEFKGTTFFVNSQSQIDVLIQENYNVSFDFGYDNNGYKLVEHLSYSNQLLTSKKISVFNDNNDIICYHEFDLSSNTIKSELTRKYYYDDNGEEKYSFDYNEDGTCFMIYNEQEPQSDILAVKIDDPTYSNISWVDFPYYQFAEPTIPN